MFEFSSFTSYINCLKKTLVTGGNINITRNTIIRVRYLQTFLETRVWIRE